MITDAQLKAFHRIGAKPGAEYGEAPMKKLSMMLRPAFIAPKGRTLVWGDFSNIEARVLPWLANSRGAEAKLDIFRATDRDPVNNPDVYCRTAADLVEMDAAEFWAIYRDELHERFGWAKDTRQSHGKVPELSLGFGGALGALQAMARNYGVYLSDKVALEVIAKWRENNRWASNFWGRHNRNESYGLWGAINSAIQQPDTIHPVGRVAYVFDKSYLGGTLFCALPCGRLLTYPSIKWEWREVTDKKTGVVEDKYQLTYMKGYSRSAMWYGKACVDGKTSTLTARGWVKLDSVLADDLLWDGMEWVPHEGLCFKGVRTTVSVDGVNMTPDHRVLCEGGWLEAQAVERIDRSSFWIPYGGWFGTGSAAREARKMVVPVRVRQVGNMLFGRMDAAEQKTVSTFVRLSDWAFDGGNHGIARHVETPGLCSVAVHAGSLSASDAPSMEELRRPRHIGVRALAALRKLLDRHGAILRSWLDVGARGREWKLRAGKLYLGDAPRAVVKHTPLPAYEYAGGVASDRDTALNSSISLAPRPVFDIINAGPRRRFMVMGDSGPFIVHNCENITQASAATILRETLKRIEFGRGPYADERPDDAEIVMHTHDEIVLECDEGNEEAAARYLKKEMELVLPWMEGLPVAAELTTSWFYSKSVKEMHL